ncbi:hypothetical protein CAEBREN_10863 [Caenorhabditis brenneri]|uniref:Uncharacterized protein n=1 Tax=Caenorhabditis brenneri TaxID=135651 RepID=G0NQW5_CAEBE|nr:hypothetical protein CAEBREN_10863 [Caenorhabditis brenneri]
MSQGNEMQDRIDAQERMNEDAGEDFLDMTDEDFLDTHMVYVPRSQNAPVIAQAQATTISSVEFSKALKKIAFNCDLLDEFKKIETEEAKLQNKNLVSKKVSGGISQMVTISADPNISHFVQLRRLLGRNQLCFGNPISQKIKELENKSGNKSISMDTIREHVESLLKLAVPRA